MKPDVAFPPISTVVGMFVEIESFVEQGIARRVE
jgi:hypothetical protein